MFILSEVIPHYNQWRYERPEDRDNIAKLALTGEILSADQSKERINLFMTLQLYYITPILRLVSGWWQETEDWQGLCYRFRGRLYEYELEQQSHHVCLFCACLLRKLFLVNFKSQLSQGYVTPSCFDCICAFKCCRRLALWSHWLQGYLKPLCFDRICSVKCVGCVASWSQWVQ